MPSSGQRSGAVPAHLAIIMDGNGRWAAARGLPRLVGHRQGVERIEPIVDACLEEGIACLTLFAFSTENWQRPVDEVAGLLGLLDRYLDETVDRLDRRGIAIRHLGRLSDLTPALQRKIRTAEQRTALHRRLTLAIAFNYGGRAEIVDAVRRLVASGAQAGEIDEQRLADSLWTRGLPEPDLIIRTAGELRLSNFLLWQAAYSEYWSTPVTWPEFGPADLRQALADYGRRDRRFGHLTAEAVTR